MRGDPHRKSRNLHASRLEKSWRLFFISHFFVICYIGMRIFRSLWGKIELTEERRRHITAFHPDVASYLRYVDATLRAPERMTRSKHDRDVVICYRQLPKRKLFLAIVIRLKPNNNFILTAYVTNKIKTI